MATEPIELRTHRLLLRRERLEDLDDVFAYESDEEYAFFARPGPVTREDVERNLARYIQTPWQDRPRLAIVLGGRVVGAVELEIDHTNRIASLGYGIGREHWGEGLTTEAARAVVDYSFYAFDLAKISARADPRNVASWRVLEKLGFQREGYFRSHFIRRGERVDRVYHGLLREEWEAACSIGR